MRFLQCSSDLECAATLATFWLCINSVRYFVMAGGFFLVVWGWKRHYFQRYRIQQRARPTERVGIELRASLLTLCVFAIQGAVVGVLVRHGYTKSYLDVGKYGLWYLAFSFLLFLVWHETYFYWVHRLMHSKLLFKFFHLAHHRSTAPSPFAAYSFHWSEAILEGAYLSIFVLVVPTHPLVTIAQSTYAIFMTVMFHSGHEFSPSGWPRGRFTRWISTVTHHDMHHSHLHCNFGLYFNFWDRICGTNHKSYAEYFEQVVGRRQAHAQSRAAS